MKRLIVILLFVILLLLPSIASAAYTEFYCQSGGSNLNSGSDTNNSASYTSNGGNWTNSTRVFTVTDGTNPSSSITIGDVCSVYVTSGATVATFIGTASTVQNATNGTVTFSATFAGTNPSNGTGTMTLKKGGAWKGPNAASAFPLSVTALANLANANGDQVRVNLKNDASYSLTSAVSWGSGTANSVVVQGYSGTVNDGGKSIITSSATANQFNSGSTNTLWIDLIWNNTANSVTPTLLTASGAGQMFVRNVFRNARNQGTVASSTATFYECEWYGNNAANVANSGNFYSSVPGVVVVNGYSHDAVNGAGFYVAAGGGLILVNTIGDTNPGSGAEIISTASSLVSINSDFYNNTGDAIKGTMTSVGSPFLIVNTNLIKNGGKGINATKAGQTGIVYNDGYGSGTQANGGADVLQSILDTGTSITYASGVMPYSAPTTGNFSNVLAAAQGVGRSHFEENDGTNTGTVGYPDIGAAQANIGEPFPTPTPTPTATATATSTPTPTATATPTAPIETSYTFGQ